MKKFLSLILCFVFVLSLSACGAKSGKINDGVDIKHYAKLGQIKDVEYKLGGDVDEAKQKLSEKYLSFANGEGELSEENEAFYVDFESGDYTIMTDGVVSCCYLTDKKDEGITHVIKNGDAYGFEIGALSTQVRDTMSKSGYNATIRDAQKSELFFVPGSANMNMTVLEYAFDENKVLFVFQDNALCATVIYK